MDLKRGRTFLDLVTKVAPGPFSDGAVPTGAAFALGSSAFLEDVVDLFPEFAPDAAQMKWGSTSYVYAFPIFFRAPVFPDRIGVGVITARAGDGELRQEWIFGSTNGEPPEAYYTPEPGTTYGRFGHPVNELAAKALASSDLGAFRTPVGDKPRLRDHWPARDSISEPEGRAIIDRAQSAARSLPKKKKRP